MSTLSQITGIWVSYLHKLVTEKPLVLKLVDSGNIISHSKPESDLKLGRFHAGSVEFSQTAGFPLCTPRQISGQNYASLGICLHKSLLKRSPLCKLCLSNVNQR